MTDNRIEQVKKIITDLCDGCEVDGVSTGLIEIASKEIVSALYSEPQVVCPKPEQRYDPAIVRIPVPSTPASVPLPPDELLTERDLQEFIEGTLVLAYMEGQANSNASATKLAKEIIAKCHQSEAAKVSALEQDIKSLDFNLRERFKTLYYKT